MILFKLIACAKWPFGGRPMKRVEYRFTDHISGAPVYLWEDTRGRYWLATHASAWFRVPAQYGPGYEKRIAP